MMKKKNIYGTIKRNKDDFGNFEKHARNGYFADISPSLKLHNFCIEQFFVRRIIETFIRGVQVTWVSLYIRVCVCVCTFVIDRRSATINPARERDGQFAKRQDQDF